MLKINTSKAIVGMVLAKPIYDSEGKLLLEEGIELKSLYIENLKKYKIKNIYIHYYEEQIPTILQIIKEETMNRALKVVKNSWNSLQVSKDIDIQKVETIVVEIIEELTNERVLILNLTGIRNIDEYTFEHSVNVCILSLIMGMALNYSKKDLKVLGTGALLHDIGKTKVPEKILNKPDILTDFEYQEIKKHSLIGYDMVKNIKGIQEEIAWIVRDHHERYDGKGYPNGIVKDSIHIFPRIVAICDVYDALTSNRVYRKGIPSRQAIEYLISMGNHQFDYKLVRIFLKQICIYPTGTLVRLATGEEALVVKNYEDWPTRPVIEVVKDIFGNPLDTTIKIDLTKNLSYSITDILKVV